MKGIYKIIRKKMFKIKLKNIKGIYKIKIKNRSTLIGSSTGSSTKLLVLLLSQLGRLMANS